MEPSGKTGEEEEAYDESEHSQTDLFSLATRSTDPNHVCD